MNEPQPTTTPAATGAEPFTPGDLLVLRRPAEPAVFWAVLERHDDRLLLVAADDTPLGLGEHDVEAPQEELGPLVLRCAAGCRVAAAELSDPLRVARIGPDRLRAARAARRRAEGCDERDRLREDLDYRRWLAELREAAAALRAAAGRSATSGAADPSPAGPRPLEPDSATPARPAEASRSGPKWSRPQRAAAVLLAASLVAAVGLWQMLNPSTSDGPAPQRLVLQNQRSGVPPGDTLPAGLPHEIVYRPGPVPSHRAGADAGTYTVELVRDGEPAAPPRELTATAAGEGADREIVYTLPVGLPPGDYRLIVRRGEGDAEEYYCHGFRLGEEPPGG